MKTSHEAFVPGEKTPLSSSADPACQPDEGYNQWVEFQIKYIGFPDNHGVALKSTDDIDLECGKLYIGTRDIEVVDYMFPIPMYPPGESSLGPLGACGRSCAAKGTRGAIILNEQTYLGRPATVGDPALRIRWQCLYKTYADNYIQAFSLNRHYEVTGISVPPKDRALGEVTIEVTYHATI